MQFLQLFTMNVGGVLNGSACKKLHFFFQIESLSLSLSLTTATRPKQCPKSQARSPKIFTVYSLGQRGGNIHKPIVIGIRTGAVHTIFHLGSAGTFDGPVSSLITMRTNGFFTNTNDPVENVNVSRIPSAHQYPIAGLFTRTHTSERGSPLQRSARNRWLAARDKIDFKVNCQLSEMPVIAIADRLPVRISAGFFDCRVAVWANRCPGTFRFHFGCRLGLLQSTHRSHAHTNTRVA